MTFIVLKKVVFFRCIVVYSLTPFGPQVFLEIIYLYFEVGENFYNVEMRLEFVGVIGVLLQMPFWEIQHEIALWSLYVNHGAWEHPRTLWKKSKSRPRYVIPKNIDAYTRRKIY